MGRYIVTAFLDNSGNPATGLSPTIRIRDLSDDSLVITDAAMSEVGDGGYKYYFTDYDESKQYQVRFDSGSSLINRYSYSWSPENYVNSFIEVQDSFDDVMSLLNTILPFENGSWELQEPNTLVFYAEDNHTVIGVFLCYDIDGNPTIDDIKKIVRQ